MLDLITISDRFDLEGFRQIFDHPDVCKNTASFTYPFTHDKAVARYEKMKADSKRHALADDFQIWYEGKVIGSIGCFFNDHQTLEIGYAIRPDYQGNGFATKAVVLLIAQLKSLGYTGDIEAGYALDNPASGRVLEKAGFVKTRESSFFSKQRQETVACQRMQLIL